MWKTMFGKCIYTSPSGYKVYQNFFFRWLTLGSNALQTVMNRRNPYKPVLHYLPALSLMARTYPGTTCLLGLGGAGIAFLLDKMPIIAVDKSDEVIDIAKKFFMVERLKNITIVHSNAVNYVQKSESLYPHLIIDLYNSDYFPEECCNDQFFSFCKKMLTEDGFLAVNLANREEQWPIFQLIRKQFTHTLVIPIKKSANMVILATKNNSNKFFLNKIIEACEFNQIFWVNSWGYIGDYKGKRDFTIG